MTTQKEATVAQKKTPTPEPDQTATPAELILALLEQLGHEPADVASLDIRPRNIRVLGKDRSLRSHKIEGWNAKEEDK